MEKQPVPRADPIPDYAEALLGWRAWLVKPDAPDRLRSMYYDAVWKPRVELSATCGRPPRRRLTRPWRRLPEHAAPHDRCSCGLHAAKTAYGAAEHYERWASEPLLGRGAVVIGLVALWGDVVECERGWRASCAYPRHLFVPLPQRRQSEDEARALLRGLRVYGVPVEAVERPGPCTLARTLADRCGVDLAA